MAITTLDGLIAAAKQETLILKTASRTTSAGIPFSMFDIAGNPGAGTLAVGNTANGLVHTDATAGYPDINTFGGGATGYISRITATSVNAARFTLFDRLFSAGAYAFNAAVTLASQPSFSSRVPGGTDFSGLEIWLEAVTAFTGNQSIAVTYTNQDGTTGRTTGTVALGVAPAVGRMTNLPLQAGDSGVQKIESVTSTVSTAGTFNVHVMRRLWSGRIPIGNAQILNDMLSTGLIQIFDTSALFWSIATDGASSGTSNEVTIQIVNG